MLAYFFLIWGVSLTHPVLAFFFFFFFFSGDFLLHTPFWLHFYQGNFSYTSRAGFIFRQGISLTYLILPLFLWREFLLHIPSCLHFYVESCLHLYVGSFSYTSHAGFFYAGNFSYTSRAVFFFMSYTSCAGFLLCEEKTK